MTLTAAALEGHLRDELIPWWCEHGPDATGGGFVETLERDGRPGPETERRLRSVTRLLYGFGVGARLGAPGAEELAQRAFEHLLDAYADTTHGGFFRVVDAAGAPLDRSKDAYDLAFVVFALAGRAAADSRALPIAVETAHLVERSLSDEANGGYFERAAADWTPEPVATRHQNPHMHWVEALLALHAQTRDAHWLRRADELVGLFCERFFDAETGTLGERFDATWRPSPPAESPIEPGHHYEWVWLLERYRAAGGATDVGDRAARLFAFAEVSGRGPDGLVLDAVDRAGAPVRATHRLWPQTERVKALAARGARDALQDALGALFERYATPSGWTEALGPDGAPTPARQRATSVYHVVLALEEARQALASGR